MTDSQEIPSQIANPLWEELDFKDLKENRELKDEDLSIVEKLADLPKRPAIDHHNYFSANAENTLKSLERDVKIAEEKITTADSQSKQLLEENLAYLKLFQDLTSKYDWTTAWGVNVVLERRKTENLEN